MRRASFFASAAVLVAMVVAMSGSQVSAQSDGSVTSNMMGTVVSSSGTALVVRTDSGDEMAFMVDGASTVPTLINVGDRVSVAYHPLDSGKYHAATVVVETPASSATGTTGTTGTSGTYTDTSLPRTASRLPLIAMIGVLSLGAAVGTRLLTRARARS